MLYLLNSNWSDIFSLFVSAHRGIYVIRISIQTFCHSNTALYGSSNNKILHNLDSLLFDSRLSKGLNARILRYPNVSKSFVVYYNDCGIGEIQLDSDVLFLQQLKTYKNVSLSFIQIRIRLYIYIFMIPIQLLSSVYSVLSCRLQSGSSSDKLTGVEGIGKKLPIRDISSRSK